MKEITYMTLLVLGQLIFWDTVWHFVLDSMRVKRESLNIYARWGVYTASALVMAIYL